MLSKKPMTRKKLKPRLSKNGWRIGKEDAEFWKCSKNTIWCGGYYRPGLQLCQRCISQRYVQRHGGVSKRNVYNIFNKHKTQRRATGGGNLFISYNPKLFCVKKRRYYAYTHVLYERVMGEVLGDKKILTLRASNVPEFEDLILLPGNCNVSEIGLMNMFHVRA